VQVNLLNKAALAVSC